MEAEKFLKKEIPYNIRQKLIGTFSRAYADTENLKLSDPAFTSQKGDETLTYIRNLKVEEQIKNEIENRFLPFTYNDFFINKHSITIIYTDNLYTVSFFINTALLFKFLKSRKKPTIVW